MKDIPLSPVVRFLLENPDFRLGFYPGYQGTLLPSDPTPPPAPNPPWALRLLARYA